MLRRKKNWLYLLALAAIGLTLDAGRAFAAENDISLSKPRITAVWPAHENTPAASTPPLESYIFDKTPLKVRVGNVTLGDSVSFKSPDSLTSTQPVPCRGEEVIIEIPPLPRGDHGLVVELSRANLKTESAKVRLRIGFPPAPRIEAISADDMAPGPITDGEVSISEGEELKVSVGGVLKDDVIQVYLNDTLQKPPGAAGENGRPVTVTVKPEAGTEYHVTATVVRDGDQSPHSKPVKLKFKVPADNQSARSAPLPPPVAKTIVPDYAYAHQPIVEPLIPAEDARGLGGAAGGDNATDIGPFAAARVYDTGFLALTDSAEDDKEVVQYRFLEAARFPRTAFGPGGGRYDDQGLTIFEGMQLVFREGGRYEVRFATSEPNMPVDLRLQFRLKMGKDEHTLFTLPRIHIAPTEQEERTRSVPRQVRHVGYSPVVETCFHQLKQVANVTCYKPETPVSPISLSRSGSARFGYGADFQ